MNCLLQDLTYLLTIPNLCFVLQNRVSELYSLVRFLRIFPYAYYFCNTGRSKASKKANKEPCTCKSLDYSFKTNWRKCDHCG